MITKEQIRTGIMKDAARLSKGELERQISEIELVEAQMAEQLEIAKNADPYWHYEPSTGEISREAKEFLLQYLKPDDIPQRLDGQIDVHKAMSPIIGASGGNQSGKTTVGAIEAFIKTTGQLPLALEGIYPKEKIPTKFPQHVRVIGEDYVNGILLNLIPTYRKWVPRDFLTGGSWEKSFSSEQSTLTLTRKGELMGTIEFMSNKQDVGSFQGPARHKMIYDEEPREDIRKENLLRFTTASRLDELYCMTPTKGMTWVYHTIFSKFLDGDLNYVRWFKLPSVTNKKANIQVLIEILKGIENYEERKMRLLGEFISLSGLIYGRLFDRKIHVIEPFEVDPFQWVTFRGLDPHTAKPSAGVEVAVNMEGQFVVTGSFKETLDTEDLKALMATRALERKMRLGWTKCDKSANTNNKLLADQNIFKLLQGGKNAIPALFQSEKFTGSIKAGVDVIKELLKVQELTGKPRLFIFNTKENQDLIKSFQSLERERHVNEDTKGIKDAIAEGIHDKHAALRYVFQGIPRWMPPETAPETLEPVSNDTGW